jgi:site-specific recombinase XerD
MKSSRPTPRKLDERLEACIRVLTPIHRSYRIAVDRFLSWLEANFPQVRLLSDLHRDPHLLGWIHCLNSETPPLSDSTRRIYLVCLRRLLRECAVDGNASHSALILPEDFPSRPPSPPKPPRPSPPPPPLPHPIFGKIFEDLIQTLATTLEPGTIQGYQYTSRHFLSYLQTDFPEVCQLSELRRNPHMVGWLRRLCQNPSPLANITRANHLYRLRCMLHDFTSQGHAVQPGLILREDFPPCPRYLPRALSPENDQRLQQELRRSNDLLSSALLLTRATGIRIGECIDLAENCLWSVGPNQWALHVPLGKLHTERLVPVDAEIRQILTRILALRAQAPSFCLTRSAGLLLPRSAGRDTFYQTIRHTFKKAAQRAQCPSATCHQLRHTFASEMVRLGVSLPALMQLLGHKDIRMTMRYVQVTQLDLQREFHLARRGAIHQHHVPQLPRASVELSTSADLPGIRDAITAARHILEMYRRQLQDEKARQKAQRLDKRLLRVAQELDRLATAEK